MASALLQDIFSAEEIDSIGSSVAQKFDQYVQLKKGAIQSLEAEIEKTKSDYEQKCYELDKKLIENASRLDNESSLHEKASVKCTQLETDLKASQEKLGKIESALHDSQQEIVGLKRIKDTWSEEKLGLQHIVEKRDLEISRLNEEWKVLSERLSETTSVKNELQLKLDEVNSSEVTAHYHTKRVEQERELLTQQTKTLTEELSEKSNQLLSYRKEKENELVSLRSQFELTCNENRMLKETNDMLKTNEIALQEKLNQLHEKNAKNSDDYHSMEEMLRSELQSQTRLAELYKSSAEDADKKSDELISAVEELQTIVKSSSETHDDLALQLNKAKDTIHEKEITIAGLQKEIEGANDLIAANKRHELSEEELAELCPTAAMTSKFIKSGMTLTQIYTKYVEQSDELIVAKEENKRLNEAMDSILEELNAKAPLLKRQREDYERALITINQLTSQTDEAATNFQHLRQEADDAVRHSAHLTRELERYKKETVDLSKQVRFLLKEVEELRGRQVQMSPGQRRDKSLLVVNEDGSCNDVSSSSELITHTLVTFKDIAELQEQNQKLLTIIRQLSDEQEKAEKAGADKKTLELQAQLEEANEELERLREDRSRQMTMVEAIVRQRDMYRVLLSHNPQGGIPPSILANPSMLGDHSMLNASGMSVSSATTTPTKHSESISKSPGVGGGSDKRALLQLQEEFEEYKKDVLANNKVFEEKIETLKSDLSQQRANCAKLEAQVEFSKERCDMMKAGLESAKKESDALRSRNTQLYSIAQQHERSVNNLNAELGSLRESCTKLQGRLEATKSELDLSKRAEDRLTTENTSLQREQRNQSVLLSNLQKVQQSMERQAFEVRSQLHSRVEAQEREITNLRQNSHNTAQSKQDAIQAVEKQLYAVQQMLEAEKSRSEKMSSELSDAKTQVNVLEMEKRKAEAKLTSVEDRLSRLGGGQERIQHASSTAEETSDRLQQELKEKSDEVTNLETRLEKARFHVEHYKELSAAAEESLKQTNQANRELMETLQSRLDESSRQQTNLEQQLVKVEEENKSLKNEKYKVTGEVERQTSDLRKQLASVQNELEGALRRTQEAIKNEQTARSDLQEQVTKAEEANDNYQREMILHSSAVQQLRDLKENAKNYGDEVNNLKTENRTLEQSLSEKSESWNALEEKLKSENDLQKKRISEIEEQNELLHVQIQTLSNQLVDLRSKEATPSVTSPFKLFQSRDPVAAATSGSGSGDGGDKSSEQLLDVIKFLRREKEIADTKCELLQTENIRVKQQLQQSEKQTKETHQMLTTEQTKTQENNEKLAKMASMENKLNSLKSVKSDNLALREERDRLSNELRAANTRLTRLQEDLSPLQTKNREMSAQCVAIQAEKRALNDEVERWKERVQQMTQSPRRQDPVEYRRLLQEKAALTKQIDEINKENASLKSESSTLKGQVRALESKVQANVAQLSSLEQTVTSRDKEVADLKKESEERMQTTNKVRRVGRRYKLQYEELVAKIQREEAAKTAEEANKTTEQAGTSQQASEALKQAETNRAKAVEEKARLQAELSRTNSVNKTLNDEKAALEQKLQEREANHSELQSENLALRTRLEETTRSSEDTKKRMDEMSGKENTFSTLLKHAKTQIEKLRKENQEASKERERLQDELKAESETKAELQARVDELQRQHFEGRSGAMPGSELRKQSAIRKSATRVNQVTPIRKNTARVMPEPQQEAQDTERPGPSSVAQVASSSTQSPAAVAISSASSLSYAATAFVHPMSPARQQQHVVSSGTPTQPVQAQSQQPQEAIVRSSEASPSTDAAENDQAIVSSSDDQNVQDEASSTRANASSSTVAVTSANVESEASSSSAARFVSGASSSAAIAPSRPFNSGQKRAYDQLEEEAPRSVAVAGSSREPPVAVAPQPKRQRGSPDQSSESVSNPTPSSDVHNEPVVTESSPLRTLRRKPIVCKSELTSKHVTFRDQSSETVRVHDVRSEIGDDIESIYSTTSQDTSVIVISDSDSVAQSVSSGARQPDQSQQIDVDDAQQATSEVEPVQEDQEGILADVVDADSGIQTAEASASQIPSSYSSDLQMDTQDDVASSSMTGQDEVIVLSSGSESDDEAEIAEDIDGEGDDDDEEDDEDQGMEGEELPDDAEDDAIGSSNISEVQRIPVHTPSRLPSSNLPPFLVIHPSDSLPRPRLPSRPAPLTPGFVQPSTEEGDGIVPCTPTLFSTRNEDVYPSISSPRVAPVTQFQFENVSSAAQNFGAVPGSLDSVDNTVMDLADAGDDNIRSVPTTPLPSSTTIFSTTSTLASIETSDLPTTSGSGAVSSSSNVQADEGNLDPDETEPDTNVQTVVEGSSIRNAKRGRLRIRVGASRARRQGANSSSNQP
uniref:Nucleoprotein TPR n=1 Tax=Phallusia mammillata TaxID=59560 RepID=A0A6F9DWE8_9ASCI|nr:nucleoprotein TPR [Phallusia mammillata]